MKKYITLAILFFGFFISATAAACNISGPNQFVVTGHQTFNYTWYSETHWYGNLVNPCGEIVGSYTHIQTNQ